MGDSLIPISDEQAKLGQEIVGATRGLGGWLADIVGDLPNFARGKDSLRLLRFQRGETHREYAGRRQEMARGAQALSIRDALGAASMNYNVATQTRPMVLRNSAYRGDADEKCSQQILLTVTRSGHA
jgi:hypothetical protein